MEENLKECPFFEICAAYIIWERIERRDGKEGFKWSERFCRGEFTKCVSYESRQPNPCLK